MIGLGQWLCSHNRHKLTWTPVVEPGLRITGVGIPDRAYIVKPTDKLPTITTSRTTFSIASQHAICKRCWVDLDQAFRHPLGWEEPT